MVSEVTGSVENPGGRIGLKASSRVAAFAISFTTLSLLPFLILAFLTFLPLAENDVIQLGWELSRIASGPEKSFQNIQYYRTEVDAAKFVIVQVAGFAAETLILPFLVLMFMFADRFPLLRRFGAAFNRPAGPEMGAIDGTNVHNEFEKKVAIFLIPFALILIFLFFPVAYIPTTGTSSGKAYSGSILLVAVINSLWGIFAFSWLGILLRKSELIGKS